MEQRQCSFTISSLTYAVPFTLLKQQGGAFLRGSIVKVELPDWNGEWWSESLEGSEQEQYQALVAELLADTRDRAEIARDIFQLGHEHGYEIAIELAHED